MFCIYLRTNCDLCHLQHKLIGFYNRDEKCLQRGTDCFLIYNSIRLVFKRLNFTKNDGHFTRRSIYIYNSISQNMSLNVSGFQRKSKHIF